MWVPLWSCLPSVQTKPTPQSSQWRKLSRDLGQTRCELSLAWYSNWFQVLRTLVISELDNKSPSGAQVCRTGLDFSTAPPRNIFNLAVIILSKDCLIGDIIYQTDKYLLTNTGGGYWDNYSGVDIQNITGTTAGADSLAVTNYEVVITTSAHISSLSTPADTWSYPALCHLLI